MCLQDLAIQAGLKITRYDGAYDAAGNFMCPDHRRAVMIWGFDADSQFRMAILAAATDAAQIPSRLDLGTTTTNARVYTRECFAGVPPGQLVCKGTAGSAVFLFVKEYDYQVDENVQSILKREK